MISNPIPAKKFMVAIASSQKSNGFKNIAETPESHVLQRGRRDKYSGEALAKY
jgi:hypothetical protein